MNGIDDALVGKVITAYELEQSGAWIRFDMLDGPSVTLEAQGDCCSQTWIEDIDAPDALLGTVISAKEIEMPSLGNIDGTRHTNVEHVTYYGLAITTTKGRCVIDYRNDSNGYYGGELWVKRS